MPRRAVWVVALVIIGAMAGAPAQAGPALSFSDAEGDASSVLVTEARTPVPSEPSLDILHASLSFDGVALTYQATMKSLAAPPDLSTGAHYRLGFMHDRRPWWFEVSRHSVVGISNSTEPRGLPCRGCTATVDAGAGTVTVVAPIESINAGFHQYNTRLKPIEPGSELSELRVRSQRLIGLVTLAADEASAGDAVFTLPSD